MRAVAAKYGGVARQGRALRRGQEIQCHRSLERPPRRRHEAAHLSSSKCLRLRQSGGCAPGGPDAPQHNDDEQTIDELRARIRKTIDFAQSVPEGAYSGAKDRKIIVPWASGKVMNGEDYLLQMTIPNVYFHIAMTYAVLRNGGVDVGKMDFLGPLNFVEA